MIDRPSKQSNSRPCFLFFDRIQLGNFNPPEKPPKLRFLTTWKSDNSILQLFSASLGADPHRMNITHASLGMAELHVSGVPTPKPNP